MYFSWSSIWHSAFHIQCNVLAYTDCNSSLVWVLESRECPRLWLCWKTGLATHMTLHLLANELLPITSLSPSCSYHRGKGCSHSKEIMGGHERGGEQRVGWYKKMKWPAICVYMCVFTCVLKHIVCMCVCLIQVNHLPLSTECESEHLAVSQRCMAPQRAFTLEST